MSYSAPPDPPPEPPPNRKPLDFDDFIGIFVAFTSIGAVLWWSFSQMEKGIDLSLFQSSSSVSTETAPPVISLPKEERSIVSAPKKTTSSPEVLEPLPSAKAPVVPIPVPVPTEQTQTVSTGFSDVPPDFWARPFIMALTQRGIMEGFPDNTFRPDQPVTRAEFANILQRAFDQAENRQTIDFKDLQSNEQATLAIDKAVQMGFMKGYPGQVFRPEQPIPKVESLVALANGIKLVKLSSPEQIVNFYQDAAQIPAYAVDEVAAATTERLVVNYPDTKLLKPRQAINRAETAALIYQGLVQSGQAEKISSTYIVQP